MAKDKLIRASSEELSSPLSMISTRIMVIISVFLLMLIFSNASAMTIIVDCNGGGDYLNIQAGINAAVEGDSVLVALGIYYEAIHFMGKGIVVKSIEGPDNTIIDGEGHGLYVVTMEYTDNDSTVLSGFTIQNGVYGIFINNGRNGSPLISDNIIRDNESAIFVRTYGSPRIINNQIYGNHGSSTIFFEWCFPLFMNNYITGNHGSPLIHFWYIYDTSIYGKKSSLNGGDTAYFINNMIFNNSASPVLQTSWGDGTYSSVVIVNNLICFNSGTGIRFETSEGNLCLNNTIVGNNSHGIHGNSNYSNMVKNNIVSGNEGYGLINCNDLVFNNDIWDNELGDYLDCVPGPGDISEDPLFRDLENLDFHLTYTSPCIDAGGSTFYAFDVEMDPRPSGEQFDIGADEWISPLGPLVRWYKR